MKCKAPADVIILSAEDDARDTLVPRLAAAHANLERVHIVRGILVSYRADGTPEETPFNLTGDNLAALDRKLSEVSAKLVVIDPIAAHWGSSDSHKNSDVRGVLRPLEMLAEKHGCTILVISHLSKSNDNGHVLTRVSGSLAFTAAPRVVCLVVEDPVDPKRRLLLSLKNNVGAPAPGLAYRVESAAVPYPGGTLNAAKIVWEGSTTVTAEEALNHKPRTFGPVEREVLELLESTPD